jgi:hypothetical protein
MRWLIRWTDFRTFRDQETIVNAGSREEAEAIAGQRQIPVTYIGPADGGEVDAGGPEFSCLGHPVGQLHVVALMACGVGTIGVLLHAAGMLSSRIWMPL